MKITMLIASLFLLILIPACLPGFDDYTMKETGSLTHKLVKWSYVSAEYENETSEWSASGGFLLLFGGFSAGGESEHGFVESRRVLFAVQLEKDQSITILSVEASKVRLKVSDNAYVEFIPYNDKVHGHNRHRVKNKPMSEIIYQLTQEYIIHIPEGEIDEFLAIAIAEPQRVVPFGGK